MIHIRGEGGEIRNGLNVYPWRERKWSIGFILRIGSWSWLVRYAPHVRMFYSRAGRA